jgi:hypothetical protein
MLYDISLYQFRLMYLRSYILARADNVSDRAMRKELFSAASRLGLALDGEINPNQINDLIEECKRIYIKSNDYSLV